MNATFLNTRITPGDIIRVTTKEVLGVIGYVTCIDIENDGLEIQGIKDPELLKQIEHVVDYEIALFPISDIKYVFKLNLIKPKQNDGKEKIIDKI